jgi:hypothetical protein
VWGLFPGTFLLAWSLLVGLLNQRIPVLMQLPFHMCRYVRMWCRYVGIVCWQCCSFSHFVNLFIQCMVFLGVIVSILWRHLFGYCVFLCLVFECLAQSCSLLADIGFVQVHFTSLWLPFCYRHSCQ